MKRSPALVLQDGQQSINVAEFADLVNSTRIKLDEKRTGKRTFSEDFMLEHSLSGQQVTSIEFAGSF
jgi:hypothetical protein